MAVDCQPSANETCSSKNYCDVIDLTTGQVVGLSFATQAGFISAIAVLFLLSVVAYKYWEAAHRRSGLSSRLIKTNIDALMLNLLFADLLMSLGAILDLKWANERKTYCGSYCNTQGAIQIVGETSVALFTFAITLYTFVSVTIGRPIKCRFILWGGIAAVIWLFVLLWAVLGYATHPKSGSDSFYTPTPYWCWISQKYKGQRLAGEYVWLWFAGFGNLLLYIPLFFVLRGNIIWDMETGLRSLRWKWLGPRSSRLSRASLVGTNDTDSITSLVESGWNPKTVLWYPMAYTIVVLPLSIVRWITFNDKGTPSNAASSATAVAVSIFNMSGLVNVVLILATRTNVLLLGSDIPTSNSVDTQDRFQVEENRDDAGATSLGGRRRWVRDSTVTAQQDAAIHVPLDNEDADTGFGGPRVRLGRDIDDDEGEKGDISYLGGISAGDGSAQQLSEGRTGPTTPTLFRDSMQQGIMPNSSDSENIAPGREYLESPGVQSMKSSSQA